MSDRYALVDQPELGLIQCSHIAILDLLNAICGPHGSALRLNPDALEGSVVGTVDLEVHALDGLQLLAPPHKDPECPAAEYVEDDLREDDAAL